MSSEEMKTAADNAEEAAQAAAEASVEDVVQAADASAPAGDVEALKAQIVEAQQKAGEYLEGWQRARAEFANYKKRVERELSENHQMSMGTAFKSLLPIVDDFDRALASVPAEIKDDPWVNGVAMVQRKLYKMMEDNGVVAFDPVGEMFDPNRHEAIGTDPESDAPSGQITLTMQRGYMIGDRVLRPALVRVAP
ncbi:MAG: nucleotide exchange factor GrpE [Anaerolineae bacterium]|nr:nucleotide exchange factor GrpE [Anaerolineae bacterium]